MRCLPLWVSSSLGDVASGGREAAMGAQRRVCRCVLGSQALSLEGIQTQFYANKLFSKGYR